MCIRDSHIASYNAYLLKKINCHINVEYVSSIKAVKYLYKYVYKGHDCAFVKAIQDQRTLNYNEAETYVQGRCITPPQRHAGVSLAKKSRKKVTLFNV